MYLSVCLKITGSVADSIDLDQMMHFAASDLDLHCVIGTVCPST